MNNEIKNVINNYYNIEISQVYCYDSYYVIFDNYNRLYFFVPFKRDEKDLDFLLNVISNCHKNKIYIHSFVYTNKGMLIVEVNEQRYVLLQIYGLLEEKFSVLNMLEFDKKINLNMNIKVNYKNNWADLWSKKLDYYQYQVSELGFGQDSIINSFSYFVGLAENAIAYVTRTEVEKSDAINVILAHRRVYYPNYKLNYYNPLNFIIDYEVRDIAEYVKSAFYEGADSLYILEQFLSYRKITNYEAELLYGRLLFPSHYFDFYEDVILKKMNNNKFFVIIDKVEEYQIFLKDAYYLINKYVNITPIMWILNR